MTKPTIIITIAMLTLLSCDEEIDILAQDTDDQYEIDIKGDEVE